VRSIEGGVVQYGESGQALLDLMKQKGQTALSAAVMEEQALIQFNQGKPQQKLVAIYPAEGTFWADHPYAVLNAEWVSAEQRQAGRLLLDFLTAPAQQKLALNAGFRPANLDVGLDGSPVATGNGADPLQPKTLLAVPDAALLAATRNAWTLTKKPANVLLVADVSGSMSGTKIEQARQGLQDFVDSIADGDQVGLYKFATNVMPTVPLGKLSATQRARLQDEIGRMASGGNTALYQAAHDAVAELVRKNDKNSINAVVLMTDGKETIGDSKTLLLSYLRQVQQDGDKSGMPVKVFTIGYGSDADMRVLGEMADATLGKALPGTSENIRKLYKLLSTYF
jgi:Ca-activated chloride channel homolog